MKKLIGIFMLAVMVTVGSAFTAEKDVFVDTFLFKSGSNWVAGTGSGVNCTGALAACKIRFSTAVDPSQFNSIGNQAPSTLQSPDTYTATGIDHDDDTNTAPISVDVTVLARFPIAP